LKTWCNALYRKICDSTQYQLRRGLHIAVASYEDRRYASLVSNLLTTAACLRKATRTAEVMRRLIIHNMDALQACQSF